MPGEVRADTIGKAQLLMEAGKTVPPIDRTDCEALDRADPLRSSATASISRPA
jgi:hypothetical protein